MQKAEKRLQAILNRARSGGLESELISTEINVQNDLWRSAKKSSKLKYAFRTAMIVLILLVGFATRSLKSQSECLVEMPFDVAKVFREPEDCSFCANVRSVDKVVDIAPEDFEGMYASTARPVVISDGTRGWPAKDTFSFYFFKNLYEQSGGSRTECQFFPYKTEFNSLREALNMSTARANLEAGTEHWYIGWSNCNDKAGKILRKHYERPYFLANTSEDMAMSWIFMGAPGDGAHLHVDNVQYTSWQAQLRGRKRWRLAPPPECYFTCKEFQVVVEPGDIIVVDTNRWYHQTQILEGDISITIGTEFD